MTRISVVATAALVAFLLARPARADVPPYQPFENACAGHDDGGACSVDLGMGSYQDGGGGYCQPGGACTSQDTSLCMGWGFYADGGPVEGSCVYADGGVDPYGNQGPDAGVTCAWGHGAGTDIRCYRHSACLTCSVQAGPATTSSTGSTSGSTSGASSSSGGTTSGGSSAGATSAGSSTGGASSGATSGAGASGTTGSSGSTGSSGQPKGGCAGAAGAVAPWLLALAVPALVRRKRGS